ncbi:MAG: L-histidine N(alpha)-methyltransferase [Bacteroidetes bacterium]|nr:L-histidine N(alpha)-methyltransferase [Bacteroidota bacterium]
MNFALDVMTGLSSEKKFLSSKYFYDEAGDKLFQQIMELDEYYLTKCEFEILESHKDNLLEKFSNHRMPFQLVEFGAGDGMKTKILISHFITARADFSYLPIDISIHALDNLMCDLNRTYPDLQGQAINGDYFQGLRTLNGAIPKAILFLGSNIGNFSPLKARDFLTEMRDCISVNDKILIGFDLKKDPEVIRKAYNDSKGITRAFNMNLLKRINTELEGEFIIENFEHIPTYNPDTGAAKSYLVSTTDQTVYIGKLKRKFKFVAGEKIFMEISQKYDMDDIADLARWSGFRIAANYYDDKKYFVDSLWEPLPSR